MANQINLGFTASGPDARAIAAALAALPAFRAQPPDQLRVDGNAVAPSADWTAALAPTTGRLIAEWGEVGTHSLTYIPQQIVSARIPGFPADPAAVVQLLEQLPFEVAAFTKIHHDDAWLDYTAPGFGDLHALLGWAAAFRGAGHARLVSRRWLSHGPWRVVRGDGDLSLVQFHDLAADAATALAQARAGHDRMGISERGGFLQLPYHYRHDIEGRYDEAERRLVISAADREISPLELRDACAARRQRRTDPDQPIEHIAYLWVDAAAARRQLHELWLRELGCWALVDGRTQRLDEGYAPVAAPPAW